MKSKGIIDTLKTADIDSYRSIPFWSWNNDLDESELVRQIEEMKAAGIGGFIMHARTGLNIEYMGEKWFSCVDACLEAARRLNMEAWVYDENGWPSGFVGGKLLENKAYWAPYIEEKTSVTFDPDAFCVFYKDKDGDYKRTESAVDGIGEYVCVYKKYSPANTDIMKSEVVDAFINETHEKYYARYKEYFGKELKGFFTDEPQYFRWGTPYTEALENDFKTLHGADVRDGLLDIIRGGGGEKSREFRVRYYSLLNKYFTENFYKKLYDWCEAHGCMLTGHAVEESLLSGQMWGCAGVMPSYEFEHIPGIDNLGRSPASQLAVKQVCSAAAQLGKKRVLTETFGCAGNDTTPKELRVIAESQFFSGVNVLCQHLLPYSIASQGKVDHPPVFSRHSNWLGLSRDFYDYFARLGFIVGETDDIADIAVLHPMKSAYLGYERKKDGESVKQIEREFHAFLEKLRAGGVTYQLIDETILARHGKTDGAELVVGNARYKTVAVPPMYTVSAFTDSVINEFVADGGRLMMDKAPVYRDGVPFNSKWRATVTFDDVLKNRAVQSSKLDGDIVITARRGEIGEFIFVQNRSFDKKASVRIDGMPAQYTALDLDNCRITAIVGDKLDLDGGESIILVKELTSKMILLLESKDVTGRFRVKNMDDNFLVLDNAAISVDGKEFGEIKNVQRISEELLRLDYKGTLYVRFPFSADHIPEKLRLWTEKGRYKSFKVNGHDAEFHSCDFDVNFREADVGEFVQKGNNIIEYSVDYFQHDGVHFALFDPESTESLVNCLYYDTEIENIYLKGAFTLDGTFSLQAPKAEVAVTDQLHKNGYPFFYGGITLEGTVNYSGKGAAVLKLDGRFTAVKVSSKKGETVIVNDDKKDISAILTKGENKLELTVNSSLHNLMGPHHFKPDPNPKGVSPFSFTLRKSWNGGVSEFYTPDYNTLPFGIKKITLMTEY